jgi:acetyl esterase/lipase
MPHQFENVIREAGAVIDPPFARLLYAPVLEVAPRLARVETGLAYGAHARQVLDVYRPPENVPGGCPVLLFMHGGGFLRGDKSDRANLGQFFARHGVMVVLPNYRLAPEHGWPAGAQDVVSAFQWTLENAARLGGDPRRIVIGGESAGAAHAAAAVLMRRFHPREGLPAAGAVLLSGVYNAELERRARRQFGIATPDPRNEAYFGTDFARYAQMSTVELVDAAPLPLLISYAELDPPQMQVQAGELFARLVVEHGFDPQLNVVRGHNHISQLYAINTADESLAAPLLEFVRSVPPH